MADEVQYFAPLFPAGTAIATPLTINLPMPPRVIRHVRIRFPPGPRGNVGILLAMTGVPVIPANVGQYIIGDNEVIEWDVDNVPNSGAWQVIGYNTGVLPHTVYLTFLADVPQLQMVALPLSPVNVSA